MSLPNQDMEFTSLTPLPASDLTKMVENIEALSDGSGLEDASITGTKIAGNAVSNAKLSTTAGDIGGAWKAWTPTWTALPVTNSTVVAKYRLSGKTVEFYVSVRLAGGDKPSGSVYFSLPLTATTVSVPNGSTFKGTCDFESNGVNSYAGRLRLSSTTLAQVASLGVTGSDITYNAISGSAPFSWGNGDGLFAHGFYEAA